MIEDMASNMSSFVLVTSATILAIIVLSGTLNSGQTSMIDYCVVVIGLSVVYILYIILLLTQPSTTLYGVLMGALTVLGVITFAMSIKIFCLWYRQNK